MNEKQCERREKQIYSLSSKSTAWRDPSIEEEFVREAMATRRFLWGMVLGVWGESLGVKEKPEVLGSRLN